MKPSSLDFNGGWNRWLSGRGLKLLGADAAGLASSLWLAYALRFDFSIPNSHLEALPRVLVWILVFKLALLHGFRQFHVLADYFSVPDLVRLFYATATASAAIAVVRWTAGVQYAPPRGVILIDFLLSLVLLMATRLGWRMLRERRKAGQLSNGKSPRRVGIVGAGEAGAILAKELGLKRGLGLEPVVFFDDDPKKWHAKLHNVPVVGPPEVVLTGAFPKLRLDEVVISMPSAPPKRIREVIEILQKARLPFRTVPSLGELALGRVQVSQLRPVEVEDLLGRPAVQLEAEAIGALLRGQTVLVTGAGGSIGSELCRQTAGFGPARLLLVERSEAAMFGIERELVRRHEGTRIEPLVVDVLDKPRMRQIFERFQPRLVFHAAAHKHVPMMESQPGEAIRNNSIGTALLAELAVEYGVDRFVLISTDKAINPTSVMGATKRLAEIYLQALHAANSTNTRLMAVRFGNVLGSSGSVIPIFKEQIANGGPVTVTHPEMTRYFMTIPEAVGLVLQSAVLGAGGEIFVLDMGKPVRIVDLARNLIELCGVQASNNIAIEFVGLRPGEKLFEELNFDAESLSPTSHPKLMRLRAEPQSLAAVQKLFRQFTECLYRADVPELKRLLKEAVPEYQPWSSAPQRPPSSVLCPLPSAVRLSH